MKVLILSPQPFFRVRGTPINVRNVATALAESGHEVDLLCYPFGEDVALPGVRILRSPGFPFIADVKVGPSLAKIPLDAFMMLKAWWLCWRGQYDVLHGIEEAGFIAGMLSRLFRVPFVYDMDSCISDQLEYSGKLTWKPALRAVEGLERRTMERATFVLTVCKALSDTVKAMAPDATVVQVEDAPLEETFNPDPQRAAALREELGLVGKKVLVYTGNLEKYQGIDFLLDALEKVRWDGLNAACLLVGGEADQTAAYQAECRKRNLDGVCYFVGKRPMGDMPAFMTLADALVSPRIQGTNTALKIYGYMQSAKPILATRLETHTQVLDDDTACLSAPDPEPFAKGVETILTDPDMAERGRAAAQRLEKHFSLAVFKGRIAEAFSDM